MKRFTTYNIRHIREGFSLIEILVVISIIGVLSALALISFTGTQKQARDAQRKSDLKQYQTALAAYAAKNNGKYPATSGSVVIQELCDNLALTNCVKDPKDGSGVYGYSYQANKPDGTCQDDAACATQYTLIAVLENEPDFQWIVCSTGNILKADTGAKTNPFGQCPADVAPGS